MAIVIMVSIDIGHGSNIKVNIFLTGNKTQRDKAYNTFVADDNITW